MVSLMRPAAVALLLVALVGVGEGFAGGIIISSGDERCVPLPGPFPPGFDLIEADPGAVLVTSFSPAIAVPFDVEVVPPAPLTPGPFFDLRSAIAADACRGFRDRGDHPAASGCGRHHRCERHERGFAPHMGELASAARLHP